MTRYMRGAETPYDKGIPHPEPGRTGDLVEQRIELQGFVKDSFLGGRLLKALAKVSKGKDLKKKDIKLIGQVILHRVGLKIQFLVRRVDQFTDKDINQGQYSFFLLEQPDQGWGMLFSDG